MSKDLKSYSTDNVAQPCSVLLCSRKWNQAKHPLINENVVHITMTDMLYSQIGGTQMSTQPGAAVETRKVERTLAGVRRLGK